MIWSTSVLVLCVALGSHAINRPVYKVVLTQKGYAQFLQYDVEIPSLREFTFCVWVRFSDLNGDQSIFNYVVNGNSRMVSLWLESGGLNLRVSIGEKAFSSFPVNMTQDLWHHVCLSYQADFGAWALYLDSRLVSCEAAQALYGFVIPGGGSVIIGYGMKNDGSSAGLDGEVYGVTMLLASTIERNHTAKNMPQFTQRPFQKNKARHVNNIEYVVFNDLRLDEQSNIRNSVFAPLQNTNRSHIRIATTDSFLDHDIGMEHFTKKITSESSESSEEKEILDMTTEKKDFPRENKSKTTTDSKINFWSIMGQTGHSDKFKTLLTTREQSSSSTRDLPTISEYETPPAVTSSNTIYEEKNLEIDKPPITESIYRITEDAPGPRKSLLDKKRTTEISEIELPPPPQKDTGVYGQWTSSKYAGSVLNYLKSIKFYKKDKRIPATIPLNKVSDNYPYASDTKVDIVRPLQFQKKTMRMDKQFQTQNAYTYPTRKHLNKRQIAKAQINVQILENDIRDEILRSHAQTKPKRVLVKSRGEVNKTGNDRFYRNTDIPGAASTEETLPEDQQPNYQTVLQSNSYLNALPFLKSLEYFTEDDMFDSRKKVSETDMYTRSLSSGNKWHNVKTYNRDYTPRKLDIKQDGTSNVDNRIKEINNKYPYVRLRYKPELNKLVNKEDSDMEKGRELAKKISNESDYNRNSISILKYNHGFLPGHKTNAKTKSKNSSRLTSIPSHDRIGARLDNFNKPVKIGNALSEQHLIGFSSNNKRSFEGGHEMIPDIQRYRSDIDKENDYHTVPPSLSPRVCKNVELYDRMLYVQPDESIDMTSILSPLRGRNVAINFIMQNYKKCSLENTLFDHSYLLALNWNKTPVRIFGGASPKKTTDLCGFF